MAKECCIGQCDLNVIPKPVTLNPATGPDGTFLYRHSLSTLFWRVPLSLLKLHLQASLPLKNITSLHLSLAESNLFLYEFVFLSPPTLNSKIYVVFSLLISKILIRGNTSMYLSRQRLHPLVCSEMSWQLSSLHCSLLPISPRTCLKEEEPSSHPAEAGSLCVCASWTPYSLEPRGRFGHGPRATASNMILSTARPCNVPSAQSAHTQKSVECFLVFRAVTWSSPLIHPEFHSFNMINSPYVFLLSPLLPGPQLRESFWGSGVGCQGATLLHSCRNKRFQVSMDVIHLRNVVLSLQLTLNTGPGPSLGKTRWQVVTL